MELVERRAIGELAGQRFETLEVEQVAVPVVRAGLRHDVDDAAGGAAEFAGAPLAMTWNSFTASSVISTAARCPPTCSPKKPLL